MQGVVPCRLEKMKMTMTAKKKSVKTQLDMDKIARGLGAQRRGKASAKKTVKKSAKKTVKKTVKKLPVKRYPIDDDFLLAIITKVFGDILNQGVRRPRNATV